VVTKFTAAFIVGSAAFCPGGVRSFRMILVIRSHYLLIQNQATTSNTVYDNQKQIQNVEWSKYLGTLITDDARRICVIESRIAVSNTAFNKKKTLFTSKLDLSVRKEPVKCYS
jgi:hypothetical protein